VVKIAAKAPMMNSREYGWRTIRAPGDKLAVEVTVLAMVIINPQTNKDGSRYLGLNFRKIAKMV